MSVEESSLFELTNFATFEGGSKISTASLTESKNFIYGFVVLDNKKLNFCHYPKHRKEDKLKQNNLQDFKTGR